MSRIVVLGAAGIIGRAIVQDLADDVEEVPCAHYADVNLPVIGLDMLPPTDRPRQFANISQ